MAAVKKVYQPVMDFLNTNKDKKVSDILAQITELMGAKSSRTEGASFIKDAKGNTVAIHDYYFKRWMPLVGDKKVDFGQKVKTATGYNSASKAGIALWSKQQKAAKQAEMNLLNDVAAGKIKPDQIAEARAKIEAGRKAIEKTTLGFATLEEVLSYLKANKVEVTDTAGKVGSSLNQVAPSTKNKAA